MITVLFWTLSSIASLGFWKTKYAGQGMATPREDLAVTPSSHGLLALPVKCPIPEASDVSQLLHHGDSSPAPSPVGEALM